MRRAATERVALVGVALAIATACGTPRGAPRLREPRATSAGDETTTATATPVTLPSGDWRDAYASRRALRTLRGRASYYHDSLAGRSTASGEPYDPAQFTAAHRELPFGTVLRVVRADTGESVVVRVNDRGPYGRRRRLVDLSRAAAEELDMVAAGVVEVRAEVLEYGDRGR